MKSALLLLLASAAPSVLAQKGGQSISGKCTAQSCVIAALAQSTQEPFSAAALGGAGGKKGKGGGDAPAKPSGGNKGGNDCITKMYKKLGFKAPEGFPFRVEEFQQTLLHTDVALNRQRRTLEIAAIKERRRRSDLGVHEVEWSDAEAATEAAPEAGPEAEVVVAAAETQQAACKKYSLIFARGTTEGGTMGQTVGPALSRGLGPEWDVSGVKYDASVNGIYCIGMPGGEKGKNQLEELAKRCPDTKIFLSGYSQGAMVVREAAAWTSDEVRGHVGGLLLYGDPFNGATVKGINQEKVKTICNNSDGVCNGKFSISAGHLSYASDGSIKTGVSWLKQQASSGGSAAVKGGSSSAPAASAAKGKKGAPAKQSAPAAEEGGAEAADA